MVEFNDSLNHTVIFKLIITVDNYIIAQEPL